MSFFGLFRKADERESSTRSATPEPAAPEAPAAAPEPPTAPARPQLAANDQLDLCFLCDCTASMGEYIHTAQANIRAIVDKVSRESNGADVKTALVSYRDHPPQDLSYITRVFPFTSDVAAMKGYVDTMAAEGGGDGPEAVTAALHDCLHLPWRPNATKVAVLIADAPPHGLEHDDGFPDGDPEGRDPLQICRELAARGITVYTVGCEPALGYYQFARDFMCTVAELTGGQAVALSSAALLADVIVNGSAEEVSLTKLEREVDAEIECVRASGMYEDEEQVVEQAALNLQRRGLKSKQMRTDGGMANAHYGIWHQSESMTLASCKAALHEAEPRSRGMEMDSFECLDSFEECAAPTASRSRRSARSLGSGMLGFMRSSPAAAPAAPPMRAMALECSAYASAPAVSESKYNDLVEDVISLEQCKRMHSKMSKRRA